MEQEKEFTPKIERGEVPPSTPYQETLKLTEGIFEKIKQNELTEEGARHFCNDIFFRNSAEIQKLDFFEKLPLLLKLSKLENFFSAISFDALLEPQRIGQQETAEETERGRKEIKRLLGLVGSYAEASLSNGIIFDIYGKNRPIDNLSPEKTDMLLEATGKTFIGGDIHRALAAKDFFEKYDAQFQKLSRDSEVAANTHEDIKNFFASAFAETHLAFRIDEKEEENRGFIFRQEGRKAEAWLNNTLHKYDLPAEEMLKSWFSHQETIPQIGFNISRISEIEAENPGIAKFLYQKFGIRNFERYPPEILSAMLKEYGDLDKPYGILMNPTNDWNGSFSRDYYQWGKLFDQLHEQGYTLRIMEARGKVELVKHLIRLDRQYGLHQKISFGIIGGHGTKDSIKFGGSNSINSLYTKDLMGAAAVKTSMFFEKNPTIILNSCSTGAERGIGRELSEDLEARVIAPNKPTNIKTINVKQSEDGLTFDVEFYDKELARVFKGGEEVK